MSDTEDFAALFKASQQAKQFERGQTIEGTVVAIGADVAFVDVGGKGEAVVDVGELKDADGRLEVAVGDRIQATVVSTSGGLTLSRRLARGAITDRLLTDAFQAALPVEGKIERVVKGGYEVRVGRQRAFCPFSQIDVTRTADPEAHLGRVYTFRIIEYKDDGRNLVVSRRILLEEEQREKEADVRRAIVPGAVVHGRVVSVRDYGAFIDLGGGVQGLLHASEMGWSRVANPASLVAAGDEVTVKVLRVDEATQKIALGMKQLSEDPWLTVSSTCEIGQVRTGRVTRIAEFGAFVELEAGVEGLAHSSTFAPTGRPGTWSRSVPVGLTASFEILTIDLEKRRIGLALVAEEASSPDAPVAPVQTIAAGSRVVGKVERHEKFGVFVFLSPGRTGLIPMAETGIAKDGDVARAFPIGSEVEVIVLEVDPSGRRIRLSRKAAQDAQDAQELREYTSRTEAETSERIGGLADKLRGALGNRKS